MRSIILLVPVLIIMSCTPSIIATREQQQGDAFFNVNEYDKALIHYNNFLDASSKLGIYRNLGMEADVCRKIAHACSYNGNFSLAGEYLHRAIQADSLDNNQPGLIQNYVDLGRVSLAAGKFNEGIGYLEHALYLGASYEDSFKNMKRGTAASVYLGLAQAYLATGRFDDAVKCSGRAHRLFSQTGYERGLAEIYLLKGMIYSDMGLLKEAGEMVNRSVELSVKLGINTVRQNLIRAELASLQGQFSEALLANELALEEAGRVKIIPQLIWANIRSGDLYLILGDTGNASLFYNEASRLHDKNGEALLLKASLNLRSDNPEEVTEYFQNEGIITGSGLLYLKLAGMELEKNEYQSSSGFYALADSCFKITGNTEGMARAGLGMARVLIGKELPENAIMEVNRSISLSKNNETLWQCWYFKGMAMEMLNHTDSAKYSYRRALAIIEQSRGNITGEELRGLYINDKIRVYDRLINLLIEGDDLRESLIMSEKARARAFLDLLGSRSPEPGFSPSRELIGREKELNLKLTHLQKQIYEVYFSDHDQSRSLEIERSLHVELEAVQGEYQLLLSRLKARHPAYYNIITIDPPDLQTIQAAIPSSTAVLQYWISEEKIYLWVIRNDNLDLITIQTGAGEFYQRVRQAVSHLKFNNESGSTPLLQQLYTELIEPARPFIQDVTTLCIIPHGILHNLPFHALIGSSGRFLMEDYYIQFMPSASVMTELSAGSRPEGTNFLGMALGDRMIGLFPGLPGTTFELESISGGFTGPVLAIGERSTESFLRTNIEGKDIIHLATHGVFNEARPRYSFLLFTPEETDDGQLTVNEIFGLSMESCIVTLSACETGVSEISRGDELTGLSRAFLGAGAHTVSVSLWSVADRPTAELMISFYQYLEDNPPHVAMTKAQRETMIDYPQPFYWAPFVVIGGKTGN
jgi:CHAT domain-containing protein